MARNQLVAAVVGAGLIVFLLLGWLIGQMTEPPLSGVFSYAALFDRHYYQPFAEGSAEYGEPGLLRVDQLRLPVARDPHPPAPEAPMSVGVLVYVSGLGLALLLSRLGEGPEDVVTQASALGWLAALLGLVASARGASRTTVPPRPSDGSWSVDSRPGRAWAGDRAHPGPRARARLRVAPRCWCRSPLPSSSASLVPLWTVERVRAASPVVLSTSRVSEAGQGGLSLGLALALLFPLNHLASANNVRWDHSYFKTASPGEVTLATIANLDEPIQAWLFFPTTSDVTQEVRTYFDQITHPNLRDSLRRPGPRD